MWVRIVLRNCLTQGCLYFHDVINDTFGGVGLLSSRRPKGVWFSLRRFTTAGIQLPWMNGSLVYGRFQSRRAKRLSFTQANSRL
jgi:hypothetical protein